MGSLGIYFGPKSISISEAKGKKLVKSAQILQTASYSGELEEKVPPEVKLIEIIALFKDELRRNKIEAKDATVCLSGKDLIVRTFEMPMLPREELNSAVIFEAKKYIPFRIEELVYDFQILFEKVSRTNLVLFVGIKKESLERYQSIFGQLGIKIRGIEYSAFAISRFLPLNNIKQRGVIGVLGVDTQSADEANFSVIENGFPLFCRDISLSESVEAAAPEGVGAGNIMEKLKTEVRVSLDYYKRKFPSKNINKVIILSSNDSRQELEGFLRESGFAVSSVDLSKFAGRAVPYSSSLAKAFCVSLAAAEKSSIKIDLLKAKDKARMPKDKGAQLDLDSLFEGIRIDYKFVILGILICLGVFGYGIYRKQPLEQQLNSIISARPQVSVVDPQLSYEDLSAAALKYKAKIGALEDLIKKQMYLTVPLNVMPRAIVKGLWLTNFTFDRKDANKASLNLEGMAYLADSDKEFEAVNEFAGNLRIDPDFVKYFKDISIVSLDKQEFEGNKVTAFRISCKTYQGRD